MPDDKVMIRVAARWFDGAIFGYEGDRDVAQVHRAEGGEWMLLLSVLRDGLRCRYAVRVNPDGISHRRSDGMMVFGLRSGAPGTWGVVPSVVIPDQLHAIVMLTDVPVPAPWERS